MLANKPTDAKQERFLFFQVKQTDPKNENIIWAAMSTNEIDRYDEIVEPDAFKEALPAFLANPVVLPAHQQRLPDGSPPVIGTVLTDTITFTDHSVEAAIEFDDDELGQRYARKYRKNIMRAFSIGFIGLAGKFEEQDGRRIYIWTKIELLELSAVAVPANRGALKRAKGFQDSLRAENELAESIRQNIEQQVGDLDKKLCHIDTLLTTELDEIKSLLIGDSGEFARELMLGDSLDPAAGDAEKRITERVLRKLEQLNQTNQN